MATPLLKSAFVAIRMVFLMPYSIFWNDEGVEEIKDHNFPQEDPSLMKMKEGNYCSAVIKGAKRVRLQRMKLW